MNLLARMWLLVTVAGCSLFATGAITVKQWNLGTGVLTLLVVTARYDMWLRERRR